MSASHFFRLHGKWYLLSVLIVFGVPFATLGIAQGDFVPLAVVLAFFGGGGSVLLLLKSLIGVFASRRRLPRTISIDDGTVTITSPKVVKSVPLDDCKWCVGSTAADEISMFTALRQGLVIQAPDAHFACGHEEGHMDLFKAFLKLATVPENPPSGCLRLVAIAIMGALIGFAVGVSAGIIVESLGANDRWVVALVFPSVIEGAMIALIYATCTSGSSAAARKRLHPVLMALVFFLLGAKVGIIDGWRGAVACGAANAVIGLLVAFYCRARISDLDSEREFTKAAERIRA